jgi:hypothetical protein
MDHTGRLRTSTLLESFQNVSCWADWYLIMQRHNRANDVIRRRRLLALVLIYEDLFDRLQSNCGLIVIWLSQ